MNRTIKQIGVKCPLQQSETPMKGREGYMRIIEEKLFAEIKHHEME